MTINKNTLHSLLRKGAVKVSTEVVDHQVRAVDARSATLILRANTTVNDNFVAAPVTLAA